MWYELELIIISTSLELFIVFNLFNLKYFN